LSARITIDLPQGGFVFVQATRRDDHSARLVISIEA
jgi:hypothetical protein